MLINNSLFAVKKKKKKKGSKIKTDREILEHYKKELKKIKELIPKLYYYQTNDVARTQVLVIYLEKYRKVLDYVVDVKAKINEPLNKYDLIFSHKEEFDSETAKKQIKDGLITKG